MEIDLEPQPEARVVVNGEPVEGVDPLFLGSLEEAKAFVGNLSPEQRSEVSIFTAGRVYNPAEI
jgi:hypothetical protein